MAGDDCCNVCIRLCKRYDGHNRILRLVLTYAESG